MSRTAEHWTVVEVDVRPLLDAAPLLYAAWVAERTADLGAVIDSAPEGLDPTVAEIIAGGARRSAVDVFGAMHSAGEPSLGGGAAVGRGGCAAVADDPRAPHPRRGRGRSRPGEREPRALHQFRQPHGPRSARAAGPATRRRPALRGHAARTGVRRSPAARAGCDVDGREPRCRARRKRCSWSLPAPT